jgi:16S rRNA processing protein RimM
MSPKDRDASVDGAAHKPADMPEAPCGAVPNAALDAPFGAFRRKAVKPSVTPQTEPEDQAAQVSVPVATPDDLVEIGSIGEAYGIKGWVRVFAHAQPGHGGDALLAAKRWWLVKGQGAQAERRAYRIVQSRLHSGTVVAQLEGVADRDSAEAMRGQRVWVSRKSFPALPEGEYYWVDLQGVAVVNPSGQALGQVADLIDNGAHTVLRVEFATVNRHGEPSTSERMIPFVDAYVQRVDLAARQIVADWNPEWDLDAANESAPAGEPGRKAGKKPGKKKPGGKQDKKPEAGATMAPAPEVVASTDAIAGDLDKS